MADTIDTLKQLAQQVRNATAEGENTAERVGRTLVGIVDHLKDGNALTEEMLDEKLENYPTKDDVNIAMSKYVTVHFFSRLFGIDGEDGAEVDVNDMEAVIKAVKVKFGVYTEDFLSAKGKNPEAGSEVSGSTTLAGLEDVSITGTPGDGQVLAFDAALGKWKPADAVAGLDEEELAQYLTANNYAKKTDITAALAGYATQDWVTQQGYATQDWVTQQGYATQDWVTGQGYATQDWVTGQGYALKTTRVIAGAGLTGGGTLAADRTLALATVGTAGTYTKVTVDAYGRVTGHGSLAAGDIPTLSISKISGLQSELNSKLDVNVFEELFEKVYVSGYGYAIRAKLALYTEGWMSAKGQNPDAGATAGGGIDEEELADYLTENGYATQSWVNAQGFLKSVSLSTISDLHSSWDALLKAAPSAYVTRWPTAAEVGALTQSTADGRYFRKNVGSVINGDDMNDCNVSGMYFVSSESASGVDNYPASYGYAILANMVLANGRGMQILMPDGDFPTYMRQSWNTNAWRGWRALLDNLTYTSYTVTKTGGGASGTWGIGITGNAATASKLQTARTISLTGAVTGSTSFNGSANASIATSFNASGLLSSLKTVDGSGSGLDADLLDGKQATDFMRYVDNVGTNSDTLYSRIGIRSFSGCYPDSLPAGMHWYNYGEAISFPVPNGMRFDLYANHHSSSSQNTYNRNGLMFRTGFHNNTINGWRMLLDGTNYNGYVTTLDNLTHAAVSDYVQVGSARLKYDSSTGALYVEKSDGTACGFYATGFVSAKGMNDEGNGQESGLYIADKRNESIGSRDYGRGIYGFFMANGTDGLHDGGSYHTVLHVQQWDNNSGGNVHQLGFTDNGGLWMRTSTSDTSWGSWSELSALAGLTDVLISSPQNGQSLVYRNGVWKNETVSGGGGSASVDWDDITGKPSWIGDFGPTISLSSSSSTNLSLTIGSLGKTVPSLYATYLGGTTKAGLFTGLSYSGSTLSITIGGTTRTATIQAGGTENHFMARGVLSGSLDNVTLSGIYQITNNTGIPSGSYQWGVLLSFLSRDGSNVGAQMYIEDGGSYGLYVRTKYGSNWRNWKKFVKA